MECEKNYKNPLSIGGTLPWECSEKEKYDISSSVSLLVTVEEEVRAEYLSTRRRVSPSPPPSRRLARRGELKHIYGLIYEETRGVLKVFLESVIHDSVTYTDTLRGKP
ncbi:hypothetical protein C0J52_12525 [Blattella germanica]|nr:hypothetical protein C0J52_12525 [Blattella germanica]